MPSVNGLPWWSAVAVAVIASAIGVAFDAGSADKELTLVFSTLYALGCIAAVLMVQQSALFSTVVQPPLILFVMVPGAYWLFRGGGFPGLKAIVINCGYPLIERFPLMLFTAGGVLLIGMVRWYLGLVDGSSKPSTEVRDTPQGPTLAGRLSALLNSTLTRNPAHAIEQPAASEQHPGERPRRATAEARRAARNGTAGRTRTRSTERRSTGRAAAPTRSRHVRPEMDAPAAERPRRRPAPEGYDDRPRRRPAPETREEWLSRSRPGPERHDQPRRRPRPAPDAPRGGEPFSGGNRDPRYRGYRPTEGTESAPRRRPMPPAGEGRGNTPGATRHPVSQVRYRRDAGEESGPQQRARPRRPREEADSWEFDI
ncbi:DUF6542 domain-containing protein [Mycolicibacter minnesotensis]